MAGKARTCERCGAQMSPRWPRVRQANGQLWCTGCDSAQNHVQTTAAGWSGEDVIRHELGRQRVHTVTTEQGESQLCGEHVRQRRSRSDFATGLAAQVGLERNFSTPTVSPVHEGRCEDCARAGGKSLPWEVGRPAGSVPVQEERAPTRHIDTDEVYRPGRWPNRPQHAHERFTAPDMTIRSLNMLRIAVATRPGRPDRVTTTSRIRVQAHDSGDGETIFHCPFCGSGQVIARSDGTVECEFCATAFTVQVQPQMPAFPQTIDGVPVDVPGMPAGGANANVPPAGAPGDPMDPDGDPGAVSGPPGEDAPPGEEPEEDDGGGDDKPAFLKGSLLLRTAAGHVLDPDQYARHLALTHARDRDAVLAQIRNENGARR